MAALIRATFRGYHVLFDDYSDPRVKDWFLMGSPFPILAIVFFYFQFITKIGPKMMEKREPYQLNGVMILYNLVQVYLNARFVIDSIFLIWLPGKMSLICETVDYTNDPFAVMLAEYIWLFFISRVLDLLDSVFMVLRKKERQLSFLHIYHHSGMAIGTWIGVKYVPGGHPVFFGVVNSFVHSVMYSYYLLTAIYPEYKKSIWWKKHITELQLVQFVVTSAHMLVGLLNPSCKYPKLLMALFIPQDVFMFFMFLDFYKRTYMKKKGNNEPAVKKAENSTGFQTMLHSENKDSRITDEFKKRT